MKIGIDIDDVIVDTSNEMEKYIIEYDKSGNISAHLEEIMRGEISTLEIKKFLEDNVLEIMKNAKVKKNAQKVIHKLLDKGNEIFIITSRGEEKFKGSEKVTLEYLKNNKVEYTKIVFNSFDKAKICKENNIDLMIDDSIKLCLECEKENIKSILFTSKVNQLKDTKTERVENWLELESKIEKIKL